MINELDFIITFFSNLKKKKGFPNSPQGRSIIRAAIFQNDWLFFFFNMLPFIKFSYIHMGIIGSRITRLYNHVRTKRFSLLHYIQIPMKTNNCVATFIIKSPLQLYRTDITHPWRALWSIWRAREFLNLKSNFCYSPGSNSNEKGQKEVLDSWRGSNG